MNRLKNLFHFDHFKLRSQLTYIFTWVFNNTAGKIAIINTKIIKYFFICHFTF